MSGPPLRTHLASEGQPKKEATAVSQPFIYVGTYRLNDGQLEAFKQSCGRLMEFVESNR